MAVVENMSFFDGEDGRRYTPFGAGSGDRIQREFGLPHLIRFPIAEDISQAGDGEPTAPPALPTLQDLLTSPILPQLGAPSLANTRLSAQVSTAEPLRITWAAAYL